MRLLVTGLAAASLALAFSAPIQACEGYAESSEASTIELKVAQAPTNELSAVDKKDEKAKPKKTAKKKEKVEYMRAAPMPPGAK